MCLCFFELTGQVKSEGSYLRAGPIDCHGPRLNRFLSRTGPSRLVTLVFLSSSPHQ